MNYIKKVCSFTGYRTGKLKTVFGGRNDAFEELKIVMANEIGKLIDNDFEVFQCGMAIGSDMIFADVVLEFKKRYPFIKFIPFIPCLEQDKMWNEFDRKHYKRILQSADDLKMISELSYFDGCMQKRNRALVDRSDLLLAVYHGANGGTMQTVEYAKRKGHKIIIIDPEKFLKITLYN